MTRRVRWRLCALAVGGLLAGSRVASAQNQYQLWGNATVDWVKSERLTYEVDFEPKVSLDPSDDPSETDEGWLNLDVTLSAQYSPHGWLDLWAEGVVGYTAQTDDVNTVELTPRLGARFHLFSRDTPTLVPGARPLGRERPPTRRVVIRDLVRIEDKNLIDTGAGSGSSSMVRLRNRIEFLVPVNKPKTTDDGARFTFADWEVYVPLGEPGQPFVSKQRIRAGVGYRHSFAWRYQVVYICDLSRQSADEGFGSCANILDVQVNRVF
jgi:hypothetical protein